MSMIYNFMEADVRAKIIQISGFAHQQRVNKKPFPTHWTSGTIGGMKA